MFSGCGWGTSNKHSTKPFPRPDAPHVDKGEIIRFYNPYWIDDDLLLPPPTRVGLVHVQDEVSGRKERPGLGLGRPDHLSRVLAHEGAPRDRRRGEQTQALARATYHQSCSKFGFRIFCSYV